MAKKNEEDTLGSQNNTKDKIAERDDEIKALIEERRNIERGQRIFEKYEQDDQKVHQGQKKIKKTRKDSANTGRVQRSQKQFEH